MGDVDPRTALLACASRKDGDIGAGALWLAAEDCENVDVDGLLGELDELAAELRARAEGAPSALPDPGAAHLLGGLLEDRLHLRGGDGIDARHHYLHSVIARGVGVPIACSALWIAVGRRAGLAVEGVGLPGRFVVRVGRLLVDPFERGRPLDEEAACRLAAVGLGGRVPPHLAPAWTRPASVRQMLGRMSRNLRLCHSAGERWGLALQAADRCVALDPLDPEDRRERGLIRFRVGLALPALRDLRVYLASVPEAPDRGNVETIAARAMGMVN